jgi:hypothetical protein
MKKRILTLCAIGAIVAGVSVAQAAVTTNDTQTIAFADFVPCANGGAGEAISGELRLHTLMTSTVNGNMVSGKYHFQPEGGSLVGEITGDAYQPTGVTQGTFNGSLRNGLYTETGINNYRLIGPGPGNNLLIHENFHITISANGDTTVTHDDLSIDCK